MSSGFTWLNNIRGGWAKRNVEAAIARVPSLAGRAVKGKFKGQAHPTPKHGDPNHASGQILTAGETALTSFHAYPNGDVVFSQGKYPSQHISQNAESALAIADGRPNHAAQWIPDPHGGYKVVVDGKVYAAHYDQYVQNYYYEHGGQKHYKK